MSTLTPHTAVRNVVFLVGAPDPATAPANVQLTHEFDRDESLASLTRVLREMHHGADLNVTELRVVLPKWSETLVKLIQLRAELQDSKLLCFNLCEGTEIDGYPGETIIRDLEEHGFLFTGAASEMYHITTPKTLLKKYLIENNVPTSPFVEMRLDSLDADLDAAEALIGYPMIVKPSISYASLGITSSSVTRTRAATAAQIRAVLTTDPNAGCFVEQFLAGREWTVVVTGNKPDVKVYPAAERVFKPSLPENERFLAFDRYWDGWTLESRPDSSVQTEPYYRYELAPKEWQERLMQVARDAYLACAGTGYGRVDMRTTNLVDCDVYVLEVNANCGLTFDESSSLGEIMRLSNTAPVTLMRELVDQSLARWEAQQTLRRQHPVKGLDQPCTTERVDWPVVGGSAESVAAAVAAPE
ncbi:hypothetical protein AMAG_07945 [Allomyces macrogynus ATCC 38327]|uniref:ATP-grasp domain-containing protein n=1 Tax=Allomyces macrogynus (strain ATCC 38327) TaxID=578462 RepID=A0A0L0SK21_ALLM3|nr:hypothetical protein AMAG_07945 [Allomyces macrogynus ATCC 38327]|eukprot:KNE62760.1 hypothetical protein AMAG_07945 [Allomyces macrogynus ATCC 38327]